MPRFEKPKDKVVVSREMAKKIRDNANNSRRRGTPNDMVIAKSFEDFLRDETVVIDEN